MDTLNRDLEEILNTLKYYGGITIYTDVEAAIVKELLMSNPDELEFKREDGMPVIVYDQEMRARHAKSCAELIASIDWQEPSEDLPVWVDSSGSGIRIEEQPVERKD